MCHLPNVQIRCIIDHFEKLVYQSFSKKYKTCCDQYQNSYSVCYEIPFYRVLHSNSFHYTSSMPKDESTKILPLFGKVSFIEFVVLDRSVCNRK